MSLEALLSQSIWLSDQARNLNPFDACRAGDQR